LNCLQILVLKTFADSEPVLVGGGEESGPRRGLAGQLKPDWKRCKILNEFLNLIAGDAATALGHEEAVSNLERPVGGSGNLLADSARSSSMEISPASGRAGLNRL